MSFTKSPLRRGRIGRSSHTRFVEVEMPEVAARSLVIELDGGGRILLRERLWLATKRLDRGTFVVRRTEIDSVDATCFTVSIQIASITIPPIHQSAGSQIAGSNTRAGQPAQ